MGLGTANHSGFSAYCSYATQKFEYDISSCFLYILLCSIPLIFDTKTFDVFGIRTRGGSFEVAPFATQLYSSPNYWIVFVVRRHVFSVDKCSKMDGIRTIDFKCKWNRMS